jgi:hypothetical protein
MTGTETSITGSTPEILGTIERIASAHGVPPAFALAVACVESGDVEYLRGPGADGGWYQFKNPTPYGQPVDRTRDEDLAYQCTLFCLAARERADERLRAEANWPAWARKVQGIAPEFLYRNQRFTDERFPGFVTGARELLQMTTGTMPRGDGVTSGPG